jgi:hypothetical protein
MLCLADIVMCAITIHTECIALPSKESSYISACTEKALRVLLKAAYQSDTDYKT